MSIRVFLALLITLSLAAFLGLTLTATRWFYSAPVGDPTGLRGFIVWASTHLGFETTVAFLSGIVTSILFFVLVNIFIVRPLRLTREALNSYVSRSERIKLPSFTFSPTEIKTLASVFSDFATRVEESHARDVEISRVKSDFISTAAHQLRTPLTGIRWAMEALQKENLTESQQALIKSAVDKSHDLVSIVGTLLDISSIESGKYKYQFVTTNLEELVTAVATDFLPLAEQTGVMLTFAPTDNLPMVRVDKERLKWVLNNLIENAIRYTPRGGSVTLTTNVVSGRVILRVRDTGIGIKDEDRNNIFERFYRAGNAVAKENQGNGLGLYIARSIVNDHRGELSFEANQEGPGTTFILALPQAT